MPNQKNVEQVGELEEKLKGAEFVLLTDYRGLTVTDLANLRRQLRDAGVEYRVAKNTLTAIAAERVGLGGLDRLLTGPTAMAIGSGDEIAAARALSDFARTSRILGLKGGIVGRQVIGVDEITTLATLPGKQQLRADLVGAVQGPAASLLGTLNSALSSLVHALEEHTKQMTTSE